MVLLQDVSNKMARRMKYEAVQERRRRAGSVFFGAGGQEPRDISTRKKKENKDSSQTEEEEEEELAHISLPREGEGRTGRGPGGSERSDCARLLVVACLSVSSSSQFRRSVT